MMIDFKKTFDMAHITKAEIARACGVSRQLVNQWYKGKSKPRPHQSEIIAQMFKERNIEPEYN